MVLRCFTIFSTKILSDKSLAGKETAWKIWIVLSYQGRLEPYGNMFFISGKLRKCCENPCINNYFTFLCLICVCVCVDARRRLLHSQTKRNRKNGQLSKLGATTQNHFWTGKFISIFLLYLYFIILFVYQFHESSNFHDK